MFREFERRKRGEEFSAVAARSLLLSHGFLGGRTYRLRRIRRRGMVDALLRRECPYE